MLWLMDRFDGLPDGMAWNQDARCYEVEIADAAVVVECQAYAFEVPPEFVVQQIYDSRAR